MPSFFVGWTKKLESSNAGAVAQRSLLFHPWRPVSFLHNKDSVFLHTNLIKTKLFLIKLFCFFIRLYRLIVLYLYSNKKELLCHM